MSNSTIRVLRPALISSVLASVAAAQVSTLVLQQGPVPGAPGQSTQGFFGQIRVSGQGGYAIAFDTDGAVPDQSMIWGSPDGVAAPGPLFLEGTHDGFAQVDWDLFNWDLNSSGNVAYVAQDSNGDQGLFLDDQLLLESAGGWSAFLDVQLLDTGDVYFRSDQGAGMNLFNGSGQPMFSLGSTLPGLPGTFVGISGFGWSKDGAHLAVVVSLHDPGYITPWGFSHDNREALLIDGTLVQMSNGDPLLTGAQPQGPGTSALWWFKEPHVNSSGDWAVISGETPWHSPWWTDQGMIANGSVLFYADSNYYSFMSLGDISLSEDGHTGSRLFETYISNPQSIYWDDKPLLKSFGFYPVDNDGDGLADAGSSVSGLSSSVVVDSNYMYARLSTATPSGNVFGLYRMTTRTDPEIYCTAKASSSNCLASIGSSPGLPVAGQSDYSLTCTDVEAARNGLFFYGTNGPLAAPFLGGTLCVTPPLGRMPIQNSGGTSGTCEGTLSQLLNDPASPWAQAPGDGLWVQAYYRDPALGDGFDAALSNAEFLIFQ